MMEEITLSHAYTLGMLRNIKAFAFYVKGCCAVCNEFDEKTT